MPQGQLGAPFPSPSHDHGRCVDEALERARAAFERKGLKFTPLREQIFREIAASHTAIGAYEVRDKLTAKGGRRLSPISVYRAIDALLYVGAISRFKSRNAYFACHNDDRAELARGLGVPGMRVGRRDRWSPRFQSHRKGCGRD